MNLPRPSLALRIPSIHDGCELECRIYIPRDLRRPETALFTWKTRGAIVAHPYAPLGGCYDDPVVNFIGGELLQAGFVVGTFNFRGAGDSEGRTSWTANPELADYMSFYGFMLWFLDEVQGKIVARLAGSQGDSSSDGSSSRRSETVESSTSVHLILGGYSYGSMIASHLPRLETVLEVCKEPAAGTPLARIREVAGKASRKWTEKMGLKNQSSSGKVDSVGDESPCNAVPKVQISYLLVSPLLPPVSHFLTIFSRLSFNVGTYIAVEGRQIPSPSPPEQLCAHRTLAIYGTQDTFTAATKLRKWAEELEHAPGSQFMSREVGGAGHFWREEGAEAQARSALGEWLRGFL